MSIKLTLGLTFVVVLAAYGHWLLSMYLIGIAAMLGGSDER